MKRSRLAPSKLLTWSRLNSIETSDVVIADVGEAGLGVIRTVSETNTLQSWMTIPPGLVLSQEMVLIQAKADTHLRQLLVATDPFGFSTRGSILLYLLSQISKTSGIAGASKIGLQSPWTEYVQFLPDVPLPTCWTEDEMLALSGTSLQDAIVAKMSALWREFDGLKNGTQEITWCRETWWDDDNLTFEDWLLVDAWFRSRALEIPGQGPSLVPLLDFCNHSSDAFARYDVDENGNIVLLTSSDKCDTTEITINYGQNKSAAEMLFSYGFIDDGMAETSGIRLSLRDLHINEENVDLIRARQALFVSEPTLLLVNDRHGVFDWDSEYLWYAVRHHADIEELIYARLLCVNAEDGLSIKVAQENDGTQVAQAFWQGNPCEPDNLAVLLADSPLWPVYELRATTLVENRLLDQLGKLQMGDIMMRGEANSHDKTCFKLVDRLRTLERALLVKGIESTRQRGLTLSSSEEVANFLGKGNDTTMSCSSDEDLT